MNKSLFVLGALLLCFGLMPIAYAASTDEDEPAIVSQIPRPGPPPGMAMTGFGGPSSPAVAPPATSVVPPSIRPGKFSGQIIMNSVVRITLDVTEVSGSRAKMHYVRDAMTGRHPLPIDTVCEVNVDENGVFTVQTTSGFEKFTMLGNTLRVEISGSSAWKGTLSGQAPTAV
jgi:hypothetical protein